MCPDREYPGDIVTRHNARCHHTKRTLCILLSPGRSKSAGKNLTGASPRLSSCRPARYTAPYFTGLRRMPSKHPGACPALRSVV